MTLHLPVSAATVDHAWGVDFGAIYDTNPGMVPDDEDSIYRGFATPNYLLHWQDGPWIVGANAALRVERSSDTDVSVDRDDPSVALNMERSYTRGAVSATAGYQEESTRISELDDTGRVFFDGTRKEITADLGLDHDLTEYTQLEVLGEYQDVSFEDGAFVDYSLVELSSTLTVAQSQRLDTYVLGRLSHNDPQGDVQDDADAAAIIAGVIYQVTESMEIDLSAGAVTVSADEDDDDFNGGGILRYTGETLIFSAEFLRNTTASGTGEFRSSDRAAADLTYSISELTDLVFSSWWRKNRGNTRGETFRVGLQVDTVLSDAWTLSPSVEYREVKGVGGLDDADGAAIQILISYRPPRAF